MVCLLCSAPIVVQHACTPIIILTLLAILFHPLQSKDLCLLSLSRMIRLALEVPQMYLLDLQGWIEPSSVSHPSFLQVSILYFALYTSRSSQPSVCGILHSPGGFSLQIHHRSDLQSNDKMNQFQLQMKEQTSQNQLDQMDEVKHGIEVKWTNV